MKRDGKDTSAALISLEFVPLFVPLTGTNEKRPLQVVALQQLAAGGGKFSGEDSSRTIAQNAEEITYFAASAAECAALATDPQLIEVILAWDKLSIVDRSSIVELVRQAFARRCSAAMPEHPTEGPST
jgi:hypothetical protein